MFSNKNYDVLGMDISRNRNWELDYFSYEGEKYEIVPVSKYYKNFCKVTERVPRLCFYLSDHTDDESRYLIYAMINCMVNMLI